MEDRNINIDEFEGLGNQFDLSEIKKELKIFEILFHPSFIDYCKKNKISMISPLEKTIIDQILLTSIDAERYDERMGKTSNIQNLYAFSQLEKLFHECQKQSNKKLKIFTKRFLEENAIKSIKIIRMSATMNHVVDYVISDLEEEKRPSLMELIRITQSLKEKVSKLEPKPNQIKSNAIDLLNKIKNNYKTSRYIFGFIRGLFHLKHGQYKSKKKYLNARFSSANHYFGPRRLNTGFIKYYRNKNYESIKDLLEWYIKKVARYRNFEAHGQVDISQDRLNEGLFNVRVKKGRELTIKAMSLEDLEEIYENSFDFLLLMKHLIAKLSYTNDVRLKAYLLAPHEEF